jgi:hypothetical protein
MRENFREVHIYKMSEKPEQRDKRSEKVEPQNIEQLEPIDKQDFTKPVKVMNRQSKATDSAT